MKLILVHQVHQLNYFQQIKGLDKSEYDIKLSPSLEDDTSKYESVLCIVDSISKDDYSLNSKFSYLFLDDEGEALNVTNKQSLAFLNTSDKHYIISGRNFEIKHDRLHDDLAYLNLLYYYFGYIGVSSIGKLSYPTNQPEPTHKFISYLGKIVNPKRKAFIEKLGLDLEKDYLKPKPFNFTPPKDAYSYRWEMVTFLSDFIHSLNAKFELLFESGGAHFISPTTSFTTEKLLKYFWWPHPSIIVLPQFVIDKFETYGFKFPHNGYNESESDASEMIFDTDFCEHLNNIIDDIDWWIKFNRNIWFENAETLDKMINSEDLEHIKLIRAILK